jgi:hypothetical protein
MTWTQRSRGLAAGAAAALLPSAFSSPKNLKRGLTRAGKSCPGAYVPHNSPLRGAPSPQDGSALMVIENDMLSARMALASVAAPLQPPRVLQNADDMYCDADAELCLLLQCEEQQHHWQHDTCSGRTNPVALQFATSSHELVVMHALRPEDAMLVPARRV